MGARQHLAIIGDGAVAAAFLSVARLVPGDRLTLIGPNVHRFGAGRFYADHDARHPWRLAYLLDRPNGEMTEGFADWLAAEWPVLLPEIAVAQPLHVRRWSEALSEGAFGDFAAPRAIYGRYLARRSSERLAKLVEDGVQVQLITGLATDLSRADDQFRITLASGEVIKADRVDVATGGPANQRFGVDAGPTAFTTLYDNEEAIARVLKPGWEVTCLGASTEVLDVMHFLRAAWPTQELRLRVLRDRATPALDGDPEYRRLRAAGRIVEEVGRPIWVYAESAGNVRLRITGKECQSQEKTVPLAINTAGPGDQLLVDILISGMIAKGWLKLNSAQNRIDVGARFATDMDGVRYASNAVAILNRRPEGVVRQRVEELVGSFEGDPIETA